MTLLKISVCTTFGWGNLKLVRNYDGLRSMVKITVSLCACFGEQLKSPTTNDTDGHANHADWDR